MCLIDVFAVRILFPSLRRRGEERAMTAVDADISCCPPKLHQYPTPCTFSVLHRTKLQLIYCHNGLLTTRTFWAAAAAILDICWHELKTETHILQTKFKRRIVLTPIEKIHSPGITTKEMISLFNQIELEHHDIMDDANRIQIFRYFTKVTQEPRL